MSLTIVRISSSSHEEAGLVTSRLPFRLKEVRYPDEKRIIRTGATLPEQPCLCLRDRTLSHDGRNPYRKLNPAI
jgi:hypothetical protein